MNFLRLDIELLRRSAPAKPGKRFICCVFDMIIVLALAFVIMLGLFSIVKKTNAYVEAVETVNSEIKYYNELTSKAHLVEYVEGERKSEDIMVLKNVNRAIYLSYTVFGNEQKPEFTFDANHEVTQFGLASLENDNVAYFYTQYVPQNNENNQLVDFEVEIAGVEIKYTPVEFLHKIYKEAFGDNKSMFVFDTTKSDMPILTTDSAYCMFFYLYADADSTNSTWEQGKNYYSIFYNAYANMLSSAEMRVQQSEPYYSEHYAVYFENYCTQARITNITLIISIILAYAIGVLLPQYLFKAERTISYKIFGLGVITEDGDTNPWHIVLIKSLINAVGFIVISVISYMLPPFDGVYDAMFLPTVSGVNMSFGLVILIIGIVGAIIQCVSLFTHNAQNIINLAFHDKVVDTKRLDEGDRDGEFEGRSY